jgi:hypothetical protein
MMLETPLISAILPVQFSWPENAWWFPDLAMPVVRWL